ncbi:MULTISPECIES: ROK family transcriptional regulator [unclassified Roseivivax]|uniref:ROK family transcriptional regulator n=1 Tax=Roseivivax sp. GX 12232 TaxID=2900547 RepID=UPI001E371E5F|nr:ROK family transcriptional regulator [Roseivivax sp. GX 12232]MCE0504069.1 ROK family transcriptional regulator [Roseivivax sp. GX 12232]
MAPRDKEDMLRATPFRGSNQTTVRGANERLVLHLVRQCGALTKAEATRATGLSPNAVSVIFKALEADGYLLRGDPIRGRVGQPSVPMRLNPAVRHYLGLKIGRHSYDLVAADFLGQVVARRTARHAYPTPTSAAAFLRGALRPLLRSARLKPEDLSGSSVAMPSELWHWTEDFGAPSEEMAAWRDFDAARDLGPLLPGPISTENDGTAACRAELVFGPRRSHSDFVYFFVGAFIGGGLVLNGSVFAGARGNSGGFGPMRVPDEPGGQRLVDHASLVVLERLLAEAGEDPAALYRDPEAWEAFEPVVGPWILRAARSLAHAIVSTLAVIDVEAVVIDGAMPPGMRARLVREVGRQLDLLDLQGVIRPEVEAGHFGSVARALGAAAYRISADHMVDGSRLLTPAAAG